MINHAARSPTHVKKFLAVKYLRSTWIAGRTKKFIYWEVTNECQICKVSLESVFDKPFNLITWKRSMAQLLFFLGFLFRFLVEMHFEKAIPFDYLHVNLWADLTQKGNYYTDCTNNCCKKLQKHSCKKTSLLHESTIQLL